jgi:hypothetical protein
MELSYYPESCAVFMLKLVASEYVQLIQYLRALLSDLLWLLTRRRTFDNFQIGWAEECWSDLVQLQRRMDDHRRSVKAICLSLESSADAWTAGGRAQPWTNPIPDFLFIDQQLQILREQSETGVDAFNGLASTISNRRSLLKARGATALGLVGTIFIPTSLIASILSLPDNY